jgi:hypothetical protein
MKLAIIGSRNFIDYDNLKNTVLSIFFIDSIDEIVSGGAKGADSLAERFSREVLNKEPKVFPADWDKHGKAAGNIRNNDIIDYADEVIAFWDGRTERCGTYNAMALARKQNKPLYTINIGI